MSDLEAALPAGHCHACGPKLPATPRYPLPGSCAACGHPVLIFQDGDGIACLLYDPAPGEGEHFAALLSKDGSQIIASGDATAIDCKGRFPLYRAHYFSCPHRERWGDTP